jgi:vesicle transport through interaction with t-SNAREs protein 1
MAPTSLAPQVKNMDMEARSLPPAMGQPLLSKVKNYKEDLNALKEKSRNAATAAPTGDAARAELGLAGDYYSTSAGQREKMLTATQKLENSSQNLTYAQSVLDEAQATGADILVNLDSQRQTILRSRETLQGADDNISKARKVLSSIARRAMQNKIILFGVIGFLVLAIVIIIWVKVRGSSSPAPSP